jgi:repressor LexA
MGSTEPKPNDNDDLFKMIGSNVRKYRKLKGLTIVQLNYKSGIGTTSIYEIEHGKVNAQVGTLKIIADALEISVANLFEGI